MKDLNSIDYLKNGNSIQKRAWSALTKLGLFETLSRFDPILAGTIPISIDISGSDLDIICCALDLSEFESTIHLEFSNLEDFKCHRSIIRDVESSISSFYYEDLHFEIFGQKTHSHEQYAVIHMIVERRILDILGEKGRIKIIELKESGLKTEPAFCELLNLKGDPFDKLAELYKLNDLELKEVLKCVKL
jgi:hypothetical protein